MTRPGPEGGPAVAFQGEPGAFSEEAVFTHFGAGVRPLPCRSFDDVGDAVRSGRAQHGVLPVENSLAGTVQGAYDTLLKGGLRISGEVVIPIRHFLLGVPAAGLDGLVRVISHPVALAQCGRFLSRRPGVEVVAVYDTAGAAQQVAREGDRTLAAVASRAAAERYGLSVLAGDIQDRDDNQTRFYVVEGDRHSVGAASPDRPRPEAPGHAWKSVIVLEVEDRPGALLDVLGPLAEARLDLSKLESRPGDLPFRYRFILEIRNPLTSPEARAAVEEVRARSTALRVLGSFPVGSRGGGLRDARAPARIGPAPFPSPPPAGG